MAKWRNQADKRILTMRSTVATLSIKVYEEQIPNGIDDLKTRIRDIDPKKMQVVMMIHDRDSLGDDFYAPATEKTHYHIAIRTDRNKSKVGTILNALGIHFRPGIDDEMRDRHGLETIKRGFDNFVVYLMHETPEAIADGKEPYSIDEFISNLSVEEIKQVIDGYHRVSENKRRVTHDELVALDEYAFNLGYELKNYDDWFGAQPFVVRSHSKAKVFRESYYRGVRKRLREDNSVVRCSIFICGDADAGKTKNAELALAGRETLVINGGASGTLDDLLPSTDALIVNDYMVWNMINMADNYACQVYRRGSNNPYWFGDYFVITSNLTFQRWLRDQYPNASDAETRLALESRFYSCHIGESPDGFRMLICDQKSTRGTLEDQRIRDEKFQFFFREFNRNLMTYQIKNESEGIENDEVREIEETN